MQIKSNTPKLSPTELYLFARALESTIKEFYDVPENRKKFEEWNNSQTKWQEVKSPVGDRKE